jgi:DNA-directed RNA polymerase subunit RPC12/RpoP
MEEPMYNSLLTCPVCGASYRDLGQGSLIGFNCGGTVQPRENGTLGIVHPGRWAVQEYKDLTVKLREREDQLFFLKREIDKTIDNLVGEMDKISGALALLVARCKMAQNRIPLALIGRNVNYMCLCCGEEAKDGQILHGTNCAYTILSKGIKEADTINIELSEKHKLKSAIPFLRASLEDPQNENVCTQNVNHGG